MKKLIILAVIVATTNVRAECGLKLDGGHVWYSKHANLPVRCDLTVKRGMITGYCDILDQHQWAEENGTSSIANVSGRIAIDKTCHVTGQLTIHKSDGLGANIESDIDAQWMGRRIEGILVSKRYLETSMFSGVKR